MPERLMRSLRARLLVALLGPLAALVAIGAWLDYRAADSLARSAHDRALTGLAIGVAARLETDRDSDLPAHLVAMMRTTIRFNPEDRLLHLVLDERGRAISGDEALAPLTGRRDDQNPTLLDATVGGARVRAAVYAYEGPDGRATIVVAETLQQRNAEVRHAILVAAATNGAMALAVSLLAVLAVGFALRPLNALGARMDAHDLRDLERVRVGQVPLEVAPVVRALNRLIQRLRRAVRERQAFVNDTAHQLRTPLTGLATQADLLCHDALPEASAERARALAAGVQRLAHLVQQLLALARAEEDGAPLPAPEPVQLPDLLQEAASACLDHALARGVDLGFEPAPATVLGSAWMLRELLVNLVDNAVQHTPAGTAVTVRCGPAGPGTGPFLEVEDDGPGIPVAERERVFERFVRLGAGDTQGTGLGLAIVRRIARRHRAVVRLLDGAGGRGLRVRIVFPR